MYLIIQAFAEDADCVKFLSDETVKAKFSAAKKLSDVDAKDYDAVFYVGGHGPIIDLSQDPINAKLVSEVSFVVSACSQIRAPHTYTRP